MDTLKKFFYFTYGVVALVIVSILFFNVSLTEMLGTEGTIVFWMVVALCLLGMLSVGVVGDYMETRALAKKVDRLTQENVDLKARLYEYTHAAKGEPSPEVNTSKRGSFFSRFGWEKKDDLPNRLKTDN